MSHRLPGFPAICLAVAAVLTCAGARVRGQTASAGRGGGAEITIVRPVVDKAAGKVTLPGAFWNSHTAVWVETALCGRPSDFLHETVVCATTTRALLEQALRDIGCHDGDAWADSVKEFPQVRGDRFMILLEFTRDGKKETWSLDELLALQTADLSWSTPGGIGPFGFIFRGDPDHSKAPATAPAEPGQAALTDSAKILRDDPQIALTFKQLQNMSQSFADQPLAYLEDWPYPPLNRGRNYTALPAAVYDSNGDVPVTLTFLKVGEEELISQSAKVWHDGPFREYMLKQLPIAREIDRDKKEYWDLRQDSARSKAVAPELRGADKAGELAGRLAMLRTRIAKNYAALDSAWTAWMVDHAGFPSKDDAAVAAFKRQSELWKQHMRLLADKADQLAIAQDCAYQQAQLEAGGAPDPRALASLRGREIAARSAALRADNEQDRAYWHEQLKQVDAANDPRDVWIKTVRLNAQLTDDRATAAAAGMDFGRALEAGAAPPSELARLQQEYLRASVAATLGEKRVALAGVEFEISKREGLGGDPDLPALRKQRDDLQQAIRQLEQAASGPASRPQ